MDSNPIINGTIIQGYKIIKFLGKGKFSEVYQAERILDQKLVALKIIKIYDIMDKETVQKCLKEVDLLKKVSHPNIVKYYDSFITNNELFIAIEWADKGDVKKLIKKFKQEGDLIEESHIIKYTKEIAGALQHMHNQRVIHRDLKPANILIFSDGTFKLGDLGLGRSLSKETIKAFSRVGTPLYMAPEVINNKGYDFKSDNWSLGCVIYELVTLKSPFQTNEKISVMDLFKIITQGQYKDIDDPKYKTAKIIINGLIKINPNERMELKDVIHICDLYISKLEEKPKFDPFIIMDDINEKLKLLNYEKNFCLKFNKNLINKFYFAVNIYGFDFNNENNSQMENFPVQFSYFYDLCYWLIYLIKQNLNLNKIQDFDFKIKQYDKKKSHENQMNELIEDLKSIDIKIILNSKFKYGYGDGVCLVLTQLCDKYLIKQNYIFNKPKFKDKKDKIEEIKKNYDDIILEENIGTNFGFKPKTGNNFASAFKNNITSTKNKFFQGYGKKRFNSYNNNEDINIVTTDISNNEDQNNNLINLNNKNILRSNIQQNEWNREFKRVENILEIPEESQLIESQSDNSINNKFDNNNLNGNYFDKGILKRLYNFNINFNNNYYLINNINDYNQKIENQLQKINKIENSLCNNNANKNNLSKLKLTQNAIKHYKEEYDHIKIEIDDMKNEKEKIEKKIKKYENIEKNELNEDDKNKLKNVKISLDSLKNENTKFDIEVSLLNAALINFNKNENSNYVNSLNINNGNSNMNNENNNNEPIFSNDEII